MSLSLSDLRKIEVDVTVGVVPFDEPGVFKCKVKDIKFKGSHTRGNKEYDLAYSVEFEEVDTAKGKTYKRSTVFEGRLPSSSTEGQQKYFMHNLYMILASMTGDKAKVDEAISKATSQNPAAAFTQAVSELKLVGEEFALKIVRKKTKQGQVYFTLPLPGFEVKRPFLSKNAGIVIYDADLDDNLNSYMSDIHTAEESGQSEDDLPFDSDDAEGFNND